MVIINTTETERGYMATNSKAKTATKAVSGSASLWWVVGIVVIVIVLGMSCWMWMGGRAMALCKTENLKLTAGQQSGAAGTIYQHMVLTNTGKHKCRISGFPTAFLYGSNGYALGNSAAARTQPSPVTVDLANGESANTVLGYPQAGNFDPGVCSDKSVSLMLYPPSATTALSVPLQVAWCPGFSESSIQPGS